MVVFDLADLIGKHQRSGNSDFVLGLVLAIATRSLSLPELRHGERLLTGQLRDIGIVPGEAKYGKGHCTGKIQEQEGPAVARKILSDLGYEAEAVERICYLVGHHHTYTNIDGLDYQILVEADFIVNFYEDGLSKEAIAHTVAKIFRTASGKKLASMMFGI